MLDLILLLIKETPAATRRVSSSKGEMAKHPPKHESPLAKQRKSHKWPSSDKQQTKSDEEATVSM